MELERLPVEHVAGVGPKRAAALHALGIASIADLLWYAPARYEDRIVREDATLSDGERGTVLVKVDGPPVVRRNGRRSTVRVPIRLKDGRSVSALWFNRPYVRDQLTQGQSLVVSGRFDAKRNQLTVEHFEPADARDSVHSNRIVPVYTITSDLSQGVLRSTLHTAFKQFGSFVDENLPLLVRQKFRLPERLAALRELHFPTDAERLRDARRRLVFEEFALFQLRLQWFRRERDEGLTAPNVRGARDAMLAFGHTLPFTLTADQMRATDAIAADLNEDRPMHRLLQGDVGSGKTVVALSAAVAMARDGAQTAVMAPTEILAEQHFQTAQAWLSPLGVSVELLTGSSPSAKRDEILRGLASGSTALIIGTHALLEEDVRFARLGLVVVDEQHRFGVAQRRNLRAKSEGAHVLWMTATPIPRTLSMTLYGDMDVTVLREKPPGRQPIRTRWIPTDRAEDVWRFVRRELARGNQAYVVAPLVSESEHLPTLADATKLYSELQDRLAGFPIGLLHGQMTSKEKEEAMRAFAAGEWRLLVSTTVIEVGVDVPAATVMVIWDADRFGLAQLHQLRGRIGRGTGASTCVLVADPKTQAAKQRLEAMQITEDGFELAELDLRLRGPGELFGSAQSGYPLFRIGLLPDDLRVMTAARDEVAQWLADPGFLLLPRYRPLVQALRRELSDESMASISGGMQ